MIHSIESEQSVIGACLLDGKAIDAISDIITADDFSCVEHAAVWGAVQRLRREGRPVDGLTVYESLSGFLDGYGGMSFLAEIARNTPSTLNVKAYAEIVADLAQRRRLRIAVERIGQVCEETGKPFAEIIDEAQGSITATMRRQQVEDPGIDSYLSTMIDDIDARFSGSVSAMGRSFGLADLDDLTMGMHDGDMVTIAAPSGMGKTAFALHVSSHVAFRERRPVVIYSLEMGRDAMMKRMTAGVGNMPLKSLRDPKNHMHDEHWPAFTAAVNLMKGAPLRIEAGSAMKPSYVRASAKRWKEHFGDMGLVVVDYIGLMQPENRNGNREQDVAEISRSLKGLAKELGCPVLALSQLNRESDKNKRRPVKSDLRESSAIEHDSDMIIFVYRDEVYDEESEARGRAELIVAKQREGETGTVHVGCDMSRAKFENLTPEVIDSIKQRQKAASEPKKKPKSAMEMM